MKRIEAEAQKFWDKQIRTYAASTMQNRKKGRLTEKDGATDMQNTRVSYVTYTRPIACLPAFVAHLPNKWGARSSSSQNAERKKFVTAPELRKEK